MASVDLYRPMEAVRELRRLVKGQGFKALRIVQWLWNLPPTDRRCYPLYAECIELGIPFCCQAGHTGPLCPPEPGRPIPYIDEVAMSGTNYPMATAAMCLKDLDARQLTDECKKLYLYENAQRVFGL